MSANQEWPKMASEDKRMTSAEEQRVTHPTEPTA
jgi:hypothetical protein